MADLPSLIKFRELNDQLSQVEFKEFLLQMTGPTYRKIIISSIFTTFNNNPTTHLQIEQINTLNNIMNQIIESRQDDEDIKPLKIEYLPKNLIGEIASYLDQKHYSYFIQTNRKLYMNCNQPKTLQQIHINSKTNYKHINFAKYSTIKQISFKMKSIQLIVPINMDATAPIIINLLNMTLPIVRNVMMLFLKSSIIKMHAKFNLLRGSQINKIIFLIIEQLNNAITIASNQSLIDNSNDSFPTDLKDYVERIPKLDSYLYCLMLLIKLFPKLIISYLIQPKYWNLLCKLFVALETNADTFSWAKNDDKLLVLQIMIGIIEYCQQSQSPYTFANNELINCITWQYFVATRSKVVSPHMDKVVSITYKLLTYFANIIDKNIENGDWISVKIVDQQWFLWALTDIVVPHNVYKSSLASNSILIFIEKIIDYKCMENATTKMIKKVMKKWGKFADVLEYRRLRHYPRENVLKLMMLILKTEQDHNEFIINGQGHKLIKKFVQVFFFTDVLEQKEEISTYNIALDFFQFHVNAIKQYSNLQNEEFVPYIARYSEAICSIFAYCSDKKHIIQWDNLFKKALSLVQSIFDLEKIYKISSNNKIIEQFVEEVARQVVVFPVRSNDYVQTTNSSVQEIAIIKYLQCSVEAAKSVESTQKQMENKIFIEYDKQIYCERITPLLQIFLNNYANTKKFNWNEKQFSVKLHNSTTAIMISYWFLKLIGCTFSNIIEENVKLYLNFICDKISENKDMSSKFFSFYWVICCVLLTSSTFTNVMFLDRVNRILLDNLTKGVIDSLMNEIEDNNIIKCQLLHRLKHKVLFRYLPVKFRICVDKIYEILCETLSLNENNNERTKYEVIKLEYYGFIQYYYELLLHNDSIISFEETDQKIQNNDDKHEFVSRNAYIEWWKDLRNRMLEIVNIMDKKGENNDYNGMKNEMVECLKDISQRIQIKLITYKSPV
eukprot:466071_1